MRLAIRNPRDLLAGLVCIGIGLLFLFLGQELEFGTAFRMGPGYFPTVLSYLMLGLGMAIAVSGLATKGELPSGLALRGAALIVAATVLFGLGLRGLGLVPVTLLVIVISAYGSRQATLVGTALLAVGLTLFCTLVFVQGLGLPLRLIGPWLEFGGTPPPPPPPG